MDSSTARVPCVDPDGRKWFNGWVMNPEIVRNYLMGLQDRLCATIEEVDGRAKYHTDAWTRAEGGGAAGVGELAEGPRGV